MKNEMRQIKSKDRVSNFGEVFTSKKEVFNMLNLVRTETSKIDSRFLEPACGDGNFLTEILKFKLKNLEKNYSDNQSKFEKFSIKVFKSLYGIDILKDNINAARKRLFNQYLELYKKKFKFNINFNLLKNIKNIIKFNLIHADALTIIKKKKF